MWVEGFIVVIVMIFKEVNVVIYVGEYFIIRVIERISRGIMNNLLFDIVIFIVEILFFFKFLRFIFLDCKWICV